MEVPLLAQELAMVPTRETESELELERSLPEDSKLDAFSKNSAYPLFHVSELFEWLLDSPLQERKCKSARA